ncbi:MAG: hypothetical protein JNM93_04645 [Bacteriovoracaceae bacterium]|nr:hypothetical protein [Bacteriovoracaceae bacterium]
MSHLPAFSLDLKEQQDRVWNPGYSAVVKDIIRSSMVRSMKEIDAMPPEPIDPSLSVDQYRHYLATVKQLVIMDSLNDAAQKTQFYLNDIEKNKTGLEAIVSDLYHASLLEKTKQKKAAEAAKKPVAVNDVKKVQEAITSYLKNYSPENKNGKNVIDVFGPVVKVEVVEGAVDEIQFNNSSDKNTKVSAQFHMFMTTKVGEEAIYVETQNVLLDYLKAQQKVFTNRLNYLEKGSSWWNMDYYTAMYWMLMKTGYLSIETASTSLTGAARLEKDKAKALEDLKKGHMNESVKALKRHLSVYLEGKAQINTEKEKSFIKVRLKQLKEVIPYLEYMTIRTNKTHDMLAKLTTEQVNFMAGMFLRFMEDDVVSKIESDKLPQMIDQSKKSCGIDYPPDLTYYSLQNRLLTEYELQRYEDKIFQAGQAEDIAEIKARH